jgi:hypothetical protein
VLGGKTKLVQSAFEAYRAFMQAFEEKKIFKVVMINVNQEQLEQYKNLVVHIRNFERERHMDPGSIILMVDKHTVKLVENDQELSELVKLEKKSIKQSFVMDILQK